MESAYNQRNPAVKRLMREACELKDATELYFAQPLEDNLFEWHFTVRGPPDTDFANGVYHGRILLPAEYPMKPPSIMLLTPNGRFETNKKICLSISGYHPESWQPSWSIRTALLAIIGFMPTPGAGAVGALDYTPEERKNLAKKSLEWKCQTCSVKIVDVLPPLTDASASSRVEAQKLASQIDFKDEREKSTTKNSGEIREENAREHEAARTTAPDSPTVRQRLGRSVDSQVSASDATTATNDNAASDAKIDFFIAITVILLIILIFRRLYMMNEVLYPTEEFE